MITCGNRAAMPCGTKELIDSEQDDRLQRLARVLNEQQSMRYKVAKEDQVIIPPQGERTLKSHEGDHVAVEDKNIEVLYHRSPQRDFGQDFSSTTSQQEDTHSALVQSKLIKSETNTIAMLKLLQENVDKLKPDTGKTSPLTVWDFAGQYSFYTTHQTFLTRRAIYLLVSNVSEQLTDLVADECYFDSEGIMKCKVHELVEVWLNSIHSCAPSPEASTPPVILVGTHVDKIVQKQSLAKGIESETQTTTLETAEFTLPTTSTYAATASKEQPKASKFLGTVQKFFKPRKTKGIVDAKPVSSMAGARALPTVDQPKAQRKWRFWERNPEKKRMRAEAKKRYRHQVCERYFRDIRTCLKDKPTRFHLVDEDFAIDNTVVDSRLEDLKRKIVEVASQQPYWEEKIPARWLPLEQELMRLKAAGVKVILRGVLEDLNQKGAVPIATEELDLFLRFQHDIGTILYFSMDVLREKIVLDPQWLIDALKSLITADEMFVLRNTKAVSNKWYEFKTKGKLSPELIDAIWTKKKRLDFHENKEHLLHLMEKLNIIAKPRSYSEDGQEIKEEDYYLAPCMLRQAVPKQIISPASCPDMESASVIAFMCTGMFLPPPIFHRLVGACLTCWPIAKQKSENLIYCGCCVFDLDHHHRLTLHLRDYVIFAQVTRMGATDTTQSSELCSRARKFIFENLSKITGNLGQSLQFEQHIKCPDSDADSLESLIAVSLFQKNEKVVCHSHDKSHTLISRELLQFWFLEEGSQGEKGGYTENTDIRDQTLYQVYDVRARAMNIPSQLYQSKGVSCSDPKLLCQILNKSQQAASSSRSTLEGNCLSVGLELYGETPGNGNCFFEAVSSQLQRLNCVVQKSPQQLRQEVVSFMKTNRVLHTSEGTIDLAEFIQNETFDNYCTRMARDEEWADHIVVVAMAKKLLMDIMVVTSSPSSGPDDIIVWVVGQTDFQGDPILLGHIWEFHYESLQPIASVSLVPVLASSSALAPTDVPSPSPKSGPTPDTAAGSMSSPAAGPTLAITSSTMQVPAYGPIPSPTADAMQVPASGSTPSTTADSMKGPTSSSTAAGLIQAPTPFSTTSKTTGATPSPTSSSTTANFMQAPTPGSTTADVMQAPTSSSTTDDVTLDPASVSTPSTTDGLLKAPTSGSTPSTATGSTPSSTSISTTADVMQTATSSSTTDDVMQTPTSSSIPSTTIGPMLAPTLSSTAAGLLQAQASSSIPSTTAGPMPAPASGSTTADVMQVSTFGSTTSDVMQASPSGSTPSTTAGPMPAPTSSSTTADVMQAPTVDDTDRFMHIACLLVNVGSRVLRRLLLHHTVTPTCNLDQYLAKNRIAIDSLKKRRILNNSQMDILFPAGRSTNLGDYDITLLSALFNNIVLTISQQQLNMIQFLRDERNEIFAHAKSITVNSNDYQTFWNDISLTLVALSKQCGDPDFETEISKEIQEIQISTVQGTSFHDTLQAYPRRIETLERLVQALISSHAQESNKASDDSDS